MKKPKIDKFKKLKYHKSKRTSCFIKTSDDFFGNYGVNYDEVELVSYVCSGRCLVCVWGNDDIGYEKWVSNEEVRDLYNTLKKKGHITIKELLEMGFSKA